MKPTKVMLSLLSTVILWTAALSQDPGQRERLLQLADEFSQTYTRERAEAIRKADSLGLVIRREFADGSVKELMRFKDGHPIYYVTHNAGGASLIHSDKLYPDGEAGLSLTGAEQWLGIWDAGIVHSTHQEFVENGTSRVILADGQGGTHWHATHVAGTMVAKGLVPAARGMSYDSFLLSYDWNNDQGEMANAAAEGLRVSQHSYGRITGWHYTTDDNHWYWYGNTSISETEDYLWGFYSNQAKEWDLIAHTAPYYLIVKSAGNDRGKGPSPGTGHYVRQNNMWVWSTTTRDNDGGEDGHKSISHSATSKNNITVGAVVDGSEMSVFSGWGPTDDGRIKPDVVAKGVGVYSTMDGSDAYAYANGTSMSGPMVSGSLGLLLQHQENLHPDQPLRASTLKALVLHTANDMIGGSPGPDYRYGWGLMNTHRAAEIMSDDATTGGSHIYELSLKQGETISLPLTATGDDPLRATIVWTDPPGTSPPPSLNPTNPMLVNDLDLRIIGADKSMFFPYVLDPANPGNPATTGDNHRDNVEMIHIDEPAADASYTITIHHKGSLAGGQQDFSLIVSGNAEGEGYFAEIIVNPASLSETLSPGSSVTKQINIANPGGTAPLSWWAETCTEERSPGSASPRVALQTKPFDNKRAIFANDELSGEMDEGWTSTKLVQAMDERDLKHGADGSVDMRKSSKGEAVVSNQKNGVVLHYDGPNHSSIGRSGGGSLMGAVRFPADILDDFVYCSLESVDLYINNLPTTATLHVWAAGSPTMPGALLHQQDFLPAWSSWNTVTLNDMLLLDGGDLWVGYSVIHPNFDYPMGIDAGPSHPQGGWISFNQGSSWTTFANLGFDVNWNIRANVLSHPSWISIYPHTAEVPPGGDVNLEVVLDATELEPGHYQASIIISHNGIAPEKGSINIPVSLLVTDQDVPPIRELSGLTISPGDGPSCFDATESITTGGPGGFFVVESGAVVQLLAGQSIHLLHDTHMEPGSHFHAFISTGGLYCDDLYRSILAAESSELDDDYGHEQASAPLAPYGEYLEAFFDSRDFFRIYPNPTRDVFTLELLHPSESRKVLVEIHSILGERVFSSEMKILHQQEISLEGHSPGLYFIRVSTDQKRAVKRLIKR